MKELPPIGTRVTVIAGASDEGPRAKRQEIGTVIRHVAGWLAEVEVPGKPEPGLYAPEGMRQAK